VRVAIVSDSVSVFAALILITLASGACQRQTAAPTTSGAIVTAASPTETVPPSPTPSAAATLAPSPSASPTLFPTPLGAGPVEPTLDLVFDTPLSEIPPGEYLVLWDRAYYDATGKERYRYLTWSGDIAGVLFHLEGTSAASAPRSLLADFDLPWIVFDIAGASPGGDQIFAEDVSNAHARQFSLGTDCWPAGKVGELYFSYECEVDQQNSLWVILSLLDWQIVSAQVARGDLFFRYWEAPEIGVLASRWDFDAEKFQFCVMQAPEWNVRCSETRFSVGKPSPDGRLMWTSPVRKDFADYLTSSPKALMVTECLGTAKGDCDLIPVTGPVQWLERRRADATDVVWSPSSDKLAFADIECTAGLTPQTWVWYYDVERQASVPLTRLSGCYELKFWSSDGERLLLQDDIPRVILLDGRSYALPIAGKVVGTFRVP